jgi:hypothetical protein
MVMLNSYQYFYRNIPLHIQVNKGMIKISLDEESIDAIVQYVKNHPEDVRHLLKIIGEEALSVLKEKKIIEEGARLYREIQSAINETYTK